MYTHKRELFLQNNDAAQMKRFCAAFFYWMRSCVQEVLACVMGLNRKKVAPLL